MKFYMMIRHKCVFEGARPDCSLMIIDTVTGGPLLCRASKDPKVVEDSGVGRGVDHINSASLVGGAPHRARSSKSNRMLSVWCCNLWNKGTMY
jgi:hypothetical protein